MGFSASGILSDADATDRLGAGLATLLRPGDTILLSGEIGTGKTHLARAVIRALFAAEGQDDVQVPSPTFTLVQTYRLADVTIWHADLYRLGDASEIAELGLDDAFETDIAIVEWPEMIEVPPKDALFITLTVQGDGRGVTLTSESARWSDLGAMLESIDA